MKQTVNKYIAHSENNKGEVQTMKQHSVGVAQIMKSFALSDEYADIYAYCGLLHDIGKYSKDFQKYIRMEGQESHMQNGVLIKQKKISLYLSHSQYLGITQGCLIETLCLKLWKYARRTILNG